MKIMVSACLAGENCKYNGGNNRNEKVLKLMADNEVFTVCPEELGGLPTPRTFGDQGALLCKRRADRRCGIPCGRGGVWACPARAAGSGRAAVAVPAAGKAAVRRHIQRKTG